MHTHDIEGIVITQAVFHHYCIETEDAGDAPNEDGGERGDKARPGVIATRPATAPLAAPNMVGLPAWCHSANIQVSAAMAAAVFVVTKAFAAMPSAARALPALNPNQPTHSSAAPARLRADYAAPCIRWESRGVCPPQSRTPARTPPN